jgi:hypothetical protein
LVVEDNPQRVSLKTQGGKVESIARTNIEERKISQLSLMPEGFEKQLTEQQLIDLFDFLTLDGPPTDAGARRLPGARRIQPEESTDPSDFARLIGQVLPGWTSAQCGEGGIAVVAEHQGESGVVRTHPVNRRTPCALRRTVSVPASGDTRLSLSVSCDRRGDWLLVVKANGQELHQSVVGPATVQDGWREVAIDLTRFAGEQVQLEMYNAANNWDREFGYWRRAELVVEGE